MSKHGDDPVDSKTPVFTQAEVFYVGGFLMALWQETGVPDDAVDDTEAAIRAALGSGAL